MQHEDYNHDYTAIEQRLQQLQAPADRQRLIGKAVLIGTVAVSLCVLILAGAWAWNIVSKEPTTIVSEVVLPDTPAPTGKTVRHYVVFNSETVTIRGREIEVTAGHRFASSEQDNYDSAYCYSLVASDEGQLWIDLSVKLPGKASVRRDPHGIETTGLTRTDAGRMAAACRYIDGGTAA